MSSEKRRYIRIKDSVRLKYRVISGSLKTDSYSVDLGEGGMRLPVFQKLEPGTLIEISLYLSQFQKSIEHPIIVKAKVMWIKEEKQDEYRFLIGVQFLKTGSLERDKLISHIIKNISKK